MKNVWKICLVLVLCLSVLMVAGCKSESKKSEDTDKTPETTVGTQGGEVDQNPEGDPLDTDVGAEGDSEQEGPDENTEPPVGVVEDNGDEGESDFDVDFGELAG